MYSYFNRFTGFLLAILCSGLLYAQVEEHEWPDGLSPTEGLDYLQSTYDAIILFEHHEIDYAKNAGRSAVYQVHKRIKILSELGLNQSAYVFIPVKYDQNIQMIDAVTIKQDGSLIDLDADEIYYVNPYGEGEGSQEDEFTAYSKFAIPGVEVGDEVEIIYRLVLENYNGDDILPNAELFSVLTTYTFILPSSVDFESNLMNGFPSPEITEITSWSKKAIFTLRNVRSILDETYSIPALSLPWFSFRVKPVTPGFDGDNSSDWLAFNNEILQWFRNPEPGKNKYVRHYEQLVGRFTEGLSIPEDVFADLYRYITDSLELRNYLLPKEQGKSNEYYIYNGFMDRYIMYRLVIQFLNELGMEYHICFARNRYRGPIRIDDPRSNEIDDILIMFRDMNGKSHFLCLNHPLLYYEIDEIPFHLAGTTAAYVSHSGGFSLDSVALPQWTVETNSMSDDLDIYPDPMKPDTTKMSATTTLRGQPGSMLRIIIRMMDEDTVFRNAYYEYRKYENPNISTDTSWVTEDSRSFPFGISTRARVNITEAIDMISDSLISISLDNYIHHPVLETKTRNRFLDCYPDFPLSDSVRMRFHFPEQTGSELLNLQDLNFRVENDAGSYFMHAEQTEDGVSVVSCYTLSALKIPAGDMKLVEELNQACDRGRLNSLLINFSGPQ